MFTYAQNKLNAAKTNIWYPMLLNDKSGNVFMITAFALIPMMISVGVGVDYTRAARLQTKLQALADAAALSTVTAEAMVQANASYAKNQSAAIVEMAAEKAGVNTFNAQATSLSTNSQSALTLTSAQVGGGSANARVTVTDTPSATGTYRQTIVTFQGTSTNLLGNFFKNLSTTVGGSASASSGVGPNINFYVLMDTSPSMALSTTSAGFNQMVNATNNSLPNTYVPYATNCAFSCHQSGGYTADNMITYLVSTESNRSVWLPSAPSGQPNNGANWYNYSTNYITTDYYNYAKYTGIPLRIDAEIYAVQQLTIVAPSYASNNNATYNMAISQFDANWNNVSALSNNWSSLSSLAGAISLYTVASNNLDANGNGNNDQDSTFVNALNSISPVGLGTGTGALNGPGILPLNGGTGSKNSGDTPLPILFIVTDGMRDEAISGNRLMGPIDTTQCAQIKSHGIKIAILYTQYLPASASDGWSISNVLGFLSPTDQIAPALSTCATLGLMSTVTTDQDISAALQSLFTKAISQAKLIQ